MHTANATERCSEVWTDCREAAVENLELHRVSNRGAGGWEAALLQRDDGSCSLQTAALTAACSSIFGGVQHLQ
jgi:hypothetical protein